MRASVCGKLRLRQLPPADPRLLRWPSAKARIVIEVSALSFDSRWKSGRAEGSNDVRIEDEHLWKLAEEKIGGMLAIRATMFTGVFDYVQYFCWHARIPGHSWQGTNKLTREQGSRRFEFCLTLLTVNTPKDTIRVGHESIMSFAIMNRPNNVYLTRYHEYVNDSSGSEQRYIVHGKRALLKLAPNQPFEFIPNSPRLIYRSIRVRIILAMPPLLSFLFQISKSRYRYLGQ